MRGTTSATSNAMVGMSAHQEEALMTILFLKKYTTILHASGLTMRYSCCWRGEDGAGLHMRLMNTASNQPQIMHNSTGFCQGLDQELCKCGHHRPVHIMVGIDLGEHQTSTFGAGTEDSEAL